MKSGVAIPGDSICGLSQVFTFVTCLASVPIKSPDIALLCVHPGDRQENTYTLYNSCFLSQQQMLIIHDAPFDGGNDWALKSSSSRRHLQQGSPIRYPCVRSYRSRAPWTAVGRRDRYKGCSLLAGRLCTDRLHINLHICLLGLITPSLHSIGCETCSH